MYRVRGGVPTEGARIYTGRQVPGVAYRYIAHVPRVSSVRRRSYSYVEFGNAIALLNRRHQGMRSNMYLQSRRYIVLVPRVPSVRTPSPILSVGTPTHWVHCLLPSLPFSSWPHGSRRSKTLGRRLLFAGLLIIRSCDTRRGSYTFFVLHIFPGLVVLEAGAGCAPRTRLTPSGGAF